MVKINDQLLLLKESLKSRISNNPISKRSHPIFGLAQKIAHKAGAGKIEKIIDGKPNSYVIVTGNMVIRIPLDEFTKARYLLNRVMLKDLESTRIADLTPRFLSEGEIDGYAYFCEERLPGLGLDLPLGKMDEMVRKAADFITRFNQETAQEITLDERNFKRLISRLFNRMEEHVETGYRAKLKKIEEEIKIRVIGKPFITVWQHGDYKIENVLFDTVNWDIKGVIDWDLSDRAGLPLLDIFYLLLYKESLERRREIAEIFKGRFLKLDLSDYENRIIKDNLAALRLSGEFIKPLLVCFWLHHIAVRYQQALVNFRSDKAWFGRNIYSVLDALLPQ
jgi:hypothetical protein